MEAREHSGASRTDYALTGAATHGAAGGILGTIVGGVTGLVYGAASALLNPVVWVSLAVAGIGAGLSMATGGAGGELSNSLFKAAPITGEGISWLGTAGGAVSNVANFAGSLAAVGGTGVAALTATGHTLVGGLTGAGIGGGAGFGLFGMRGAFRGAGRADYESSLMADQKAAKKAREHDAVAEARTEAAYQYSRAGYVAAAQELAPYYYRQGQESVVKQIIEAKQRQMAQAGGKPDFRTMVGGAPADTHAQGVTESQAQPGVPTVCG